MNRLLAPSCVQSPGNPETIPYAGEHKGRAAWDRYLKLSQRIAKVSTGGLVGVCTAPASKESPAKCYSILQGTMLAFADDGQMDHLSIEMTAMRCSCQALF